MAGIPQSVKDLAERTPAEDLGLYVLRTGLPEVSIEVVTQIQRKQTFPLVQIRRQPNFTGFSGDTRFLDAADLTVHTFAEDPDGDEDANILALACLRVLRDAWLNHFYHPHYGSITKFEIQSSPRRAPDWVTPIGPVQYATLPANLWRTEARYRLVVRKPTTPPYQS